MIYFGGNGNASPPATLPSASRVTDTVPPASFIISSPYRCCFTSHVGLFLFPGDGVDDAAEEEATGADASEVDATGADASGVGATGSDATGDDASGVELMHVAVLLKEDVVCDGAKA